MNNSPTIGRPPFTALRGRPLIACVLMLALAFAGEHDARGDDPPGSADDESAARLAVLQNAAAEYTLAPRDRPAEPFVLSQRPVLRFSNPVRAQVLSDGGVFLWLDGERPVAVATLSIRGGDNISREFSSLTEQPLVCLRGEETIWTPQSAGLLRAGFDESPAGAASAPLRLAQMRSLARRFSGTFYRPRTDEPTEMRLVSQPMYRYADEENGIADAAIFCLSEANDPELLLQIELARDDETSTPAWRYSLARMTSLAMTVRLDDAEVWSTKFYWEGPRAQTDPYMESTQGSYPSSADPVRPE